jgi:hypothetical protein
MVRRGGSGGSCGLRGMACSIGRELSRAQGVHSAPRRVPSARLSHTAGIFFFEGMDEVVPATDGACGPWPPDPEGVAHVHPDWVCDRADSAQGARPSPVRVLLAALEFTRLKAMGGARSPPIRDFFPRSRKRSYVASMRPGCGDLIVVANFCW